MGTRLLLKIVHIRFWDYGLKITLKKKTSTEYILKKTSVHCKLPVSKNSPPRETFPRKFDPPESVFPWKYVPLFGSVDHVETSGSHFLSQTSEAEIQWTVWFICLFLRKCWRYKRRPFIEFTGHLWVTRPSPTCKYHLVLYHIMFHSDQGRLVIKIFSSSPTLLAFYSSFNAT